MKLRNNDLDKKVIELEGTIRNLEDRIETLETENKYLCTDIDELRREHIKEIASVLVNETFITRISEDMFMMKVREDFRKFKGSE